MLAWNHSTHKRFYEYYAEASQTEQTLARFRSVRECVLTILERNHATVHPLEVADIGCGAGTQCMMWAELGHNVHGLDVNEPLVELARERAASAGHVIDFRIGSAVELPWADDSMHVCLLLELLEHVSAWRNCLSECARIVQPGGILFLTTTNRLCPIQQEFTLPFYSWYPSPLKRYYEHLAGTTRPELVNFATYPAVNWFTFYGLRATLRHYGFYCLDRFDLATLSRKGVQARLVLAFVRAFPVLRWLAHVVSPGTIVAAIKGGRPPGWAIRH